MIAATVWGFFYGGLINPEVMARVGFRPRRQAVSILPGYELRIAPLVNLVANPLESAYGLLLESTHDELARVYGQLKATYLPFPVVTHDTDGHVRAALCYIVPDMAPGQAEAEHVLALLRPAERLGFPEHYLERIRSFLPPAVPAGRPVSRHRVGPTGHPRRTAAWRETAS